MALEFPIELEFRNVDFCGGRKTGEPGEKPCKQGENQQRSNMQTQPTYDTEPESNPRHYGGRGALSRHPCSPSREKETENNIQVESHERKKSISLVSLDLPKQYIY